MDASAGSTPLRLVAWDRDDPLVVALASALAAKPIVLFPDASRARVEMAVLIRLGDGVREGRIARKNMRRLLAARLAPELVSEPERFVMTSVPERYASRAQHTFVSFARALATDLGIVFVNDQFIETGPRPDGTAMPAAERADLLRARWRFRGSLEGRTVILVDDVLGSGASLDVACEILTEAGGSVVPLAVLRLVDGASVTERIVRARFGPNYAELLGVPEIQGSLRRAIEEWSGLSPRGGSVPRLP